MMNISISIKVIMKKCSKQLFIKNSSTKKSQQEGSVTDPKFHRCKMIKTEEK